MKNTSLLKRFSPIALGVAVAMLPVSAKALTFSWSFSNTDGDPDPNGLAVTGTISGLEDNAFINLNETEGISLAINSSAQGFPLLTFLSGPTGSSGYITTSEGTVQNFSFQFVQGEYLFEANDTGLAFYSYSLGSDRGVDFAFVNPVPGPLPVLGASAAFAWSRRLRRRCLAARPSKSAASLG